MSENNTKLYNAYRISELMKSFKSNISILENKQRGYLVTGDGKFLEEYKLKETETKTYLKSMEKYFSGKPEEESFYKLKELTYKKLMEAKGLGGQSTIGVPGSTTETAGTGLQTMSDINTTVEAINESLSKTTKQLLNNSVEFVDASKNWSLLEIAIGILIALAASVFLLRDINIRNKLEEELRIAKKRADDNALLKEQFMANMSHEIRTPMNAILGFSDLMQKTRLDTTQGDYMQAIKKSGSNLLNLINDILDFSKIEAGQLSIEKIPFSVIELLQTLRIMFAEKAAAKTIGFEVKYNEKMPRLVFGDPTRLNQILVNLVNNAIKFTSKGNVSLSCEIRSIEHDIVQLVFRVKDSGIGIPKDKQESVFERFNQGNKETTRMYGGTGLGLAIVKNLVALQNGTILLKSKEGEGSEFIVSLSYPVAYESEEAPSTEYSIGLKIPGNRSVLLTEDNELNQQLATNYLEGFGLQVEIAENGQIALEKASLKKYDLILMDIQMPVMDGYMASKKIREELRYAGPVIAMTAHSIAGEKEKCLSFGMNDYISKPFKERELFNVIAKHISSGDPTEVKKENTRYSTTDENETVVDHNELMQLARGNHTFLKDISETFIQQNRNDIKMMEEALAKENFESIQSIAHRMKTSMGFMGMRKFLGLLDEVEMGAEKKVTIETLRSAFVQLKDISQKACMEFEELIKTLA
jgi:signal transduction histidine kinase/CheY-like chemotaxis protein/HPt (histidine-containing phosphotransfer) domain-containing protein